MALSIIEVAKKAGVSHTTVSNVINGRKGVSANTIDQVQRAMKEVGYQPPPRERRRGPRLKRNGATSQLHIAVIICGLSRANQMNDIAHELMVGIAQEAKQQNVDVALVPAATNMKLSSDKGKNYDGFIIQGDVPESLEDQLKEKPCVLLNSRGDISWADRVRPDHSAAGRQALYYLLEKGSRSIFMVNLLPEHPACKMRRYGFLEAAEEADVEVVSLKINLSNQKELGNNYTAVYVAEQIADAHNSQPVGVFFVQDTAAAKVYMALHQLGHSADEWLNAICCDNSVLDGLDPKPPTFDSRPQTVGRRAVAQLLWRISSGSLEDTTTIMVTPRMLQGGKSTFG